MCLAIYLASNEKLPSINKVEGNVGFYFRELQEIGSSINKSFTKRFVVYVGSAEGCSCGFLMDGIYQEMSEFDEKRETYYLLSKFLCEELKDREIEIYVCWGGEEREPPVKFHKLNFLDIAQTSFEFREKHFYTFNY